MPGIDYDPSGWECCRCETTNIYGEAGTQACEVYWHRRSEQGQPHAEPRCRGEQCPRNGRPAHRRCGSCKYTDFQWRPMHYCDGRELDNFDSSSSHSDDGPGSEAEQQGQQAGGEGSGGQQQGQQQNQQQSQQGSSNSQRGEANGSTGRSHRSYTTRSKPTEKRSSKSRGRGERPKSSPTSTSRDPRSQGAGKLAVPAQQGTFWDAHSSSRSGGECRGSGSRSRELHKSESKSTASESRGQKFGGSATAAQDKPRDMKGRSTELPKSKSSSSSSSKEKPLVLRSGGGAVAPSKDREVQSRSSAQIPPTRGLESRPKTAALPKVWSQAGKGGVDGGRHVDSKTKVKSGRW